MRHNLVSCPSFYHLKLFQALQPVFRLLFLRSNLIAHQLFLDDVSRETISDVSKGKIRMAQASVKLPPHSFPASGKNRLHGSVESIQMFLLHIYAFYISYFLLFPLF